MEEGRSCVYYIMSHFRKNHFDLYVLPPAERHCSNLRAILAHWFACCRKFSKSNTRLSSLEVEFIMLTKILILPMFD